MSKLKIMSAIAAGVLLLGLIGTMIFSMRTCNQYKNQVKQLTAERERTQRIQRLTTQSDERINTNANTQIQTIRNTNNDNIVNVLNKLYSNDIQTGINNASR